MTPFVSEITDFLNDEVRRAVLFELNDPQTRHTAHRHVAAFVHKVIAENKIAHALVVCDHTNNTPQVIDDSSMRIDIYYKFNANDEHFQWIPYEITAETMFFTIRDS